MNSRFCIILVRSFLWKTPPQNPVSEIDDYCNDFNKKYGTRHTTFYRGLLSQVYRFIALKIKFLSNGI